MALMARVAEHCPRTDFSNEYRTYYNCPTSDVLMTLSPGILNLAPLLLLLYPAVAVRASEAIVGGLGVLWTAIPAIAVALSGNATGISCATW
jgi:hypothetical protein